MKYFEKIDLPSYNNLFNELSTMLITDKINWGKHNQICLNTLPGHEDDYLLGSGSLFFDWDNVKYTETENKSTDIQLQKKTITLKEDDFSVLCNQFKNTIFEKVYNDITKTYNVGRVRLMKLIPKKCLSWHVDNSIRLHLPIKTQQGCFMVIDDEIQHLEFNTWYKTNTLHPHTAFNGSKEDRIHLVVNIIN